MIDLLLEDWCEPPKPQALHLSTLVHQILSVIAQRGGAPANILYSVLCREGPFRQITTAMFTDVLRALGHPETGLIEQTDGGLLLLVQNGERLVEHYSFYAVFKTPEEYRLVSNGRDLGTLPIDNILSPGMMLIFSGRRWLVQEIHDREKVIMVKPAKAGVPPEPTSEVVPFSKSHSTNSLLVDLSHKEHSRRVESARSIKRSNSRVVWSSTPLKDSSKTRPSKMTMNGTL